MINYWFSKIISANEAYALYRNMRHCDFSNRNVHCTVSQYTYRPIYLVMPP